MDRMVCEYCEWLTENTPRREVCNDIGWDDLLCTRRVGHPGEHAACGYRGHEHPIRVWNQGLVMGVGELN